MDTYLAELCSDIKVWNFEKKMNETEWGHLAPKDKYHMLSFICKSQLEISRYPCLIRSACRGQEAKKRAMYGLYSRGESKTHDVKAGESIGLQRFK